MRWRKLLPNRLIKTFNNMPFLRRWKTRDFFLLYPTFILKNNSFSLMSWFTPEIFFIQIFLLHFSNHILILINFKITRLISIPKISPNFLHTIHKIVVEQFIFREILHIPIKLHFQHLLLIFLRSYYFNLTLIIFILNLAFFT